MASPRRTAEDSKEALQAVDITPLPPHAPPTVYLTGFMDLAKLVSGMETLNHSMQQLTDKFDALTSRVETLEQQMQNLQTKPSIPTAQPAIEEKKTDTFRTLTSEQINLLLADDSKFDAKAIEQWASENNFTDDLPSATVEIRPIEYNYSYPNREKIITHLLHACCLLGRFKLAEYLFQHHSAKNIIDLVDSRKYTPLMYATIEFKKPSESQPSSPFHSDSQLCQLVVKNGANLKDKYVLFFALRVTSVDAAFIEELINNRQKTDIILDKDDRYNFNHSSFDLAVNKGLTKVAIALLQAGVNSAYLNNADEEMYHWYYTVYNVIEKLHQQPNNELMPALCSSLVKIDDKQETCQPIYLSLDDNTICNTLFRTWVFFKREIQEYIITLATTTLSISTGIKLLQLCIRGSMYDLQDPKYNLHLLLTEGDLDSSALDEKYEGIPLLIKKAASHTDSDSEQELSNDLYHYYGSDMNGTTHLTKLTSFTPPKNIVFKTKATLLPPSSADAKEIHAALQKNKCPMVRESALCQLFRLPRNERRIKYNVRTGFDDGQSTSTKELNKALLQLQKKLKSGKVSLSSIFKLKTLSSANSSTPTSPAKNLTLANDSGSTTS